MARQIGEEHFTPVGRGPELQRIVWTAPGTHVRGVEYFDPNDEYTAANLRHVVFHGVQVTMVTPEEVAALGARTPGCTDLGRSPWLESFALAHLGRCRHFRLQFYDQYLDVICEALGFGRGPVPGAS